jgi:hypothetical protein
MSFRDLPVPGSFRRHRDDGARQATRAPNAIRMASSPFSAPALVSAFVGVYNGCFLIQSPT